MNRRCDADSGPHEQMIAFDLRQALYILLGTAADRAVVQAAAVQPRGDGPIAVVAGFLTRGPADRLRLNGFKRVEEFALVPSIHTVRWLIPLGNPRSTKSALEIYVPYAWRARLIKKLLLRMNGMGLLGWTPHKVLIGSKAALPLQALVSEVSGEREPVFALSLGTSGRYRKLTIQVMRPDGEILGYIKAPLTDAATERVRHEAAVLERLWGSVPLRPHIPKVLYSGEWANTYILFQTQGPSQPGPIELGDMHENFLQTLWGVHRSQVPGRLFVGEVGSRWLKTEPLLGRSYQALGQKALETAARELDRVTLPCGIAHGDFAPWNSRVENGRLFVFDWESAAWEAPIQWDVFHFRAQVASLLHRKSAWSPAPGRWPGERASFLLYLLSSACQLCGEESSDQVGFDYRWRLLSEELSRE